MHEVVVTGMGLCTALGEAPFERSDSGVAPHPELDGLRHTTAAVIDRVELRAWLKRRKDRKLMARPAQLALAAAGPALHGSPPDRDGMGLYVGVGREPGDDGESAPALIAAQVNGRLNEAAVAGPCRDVYPPLLPLKTLPNMALAHIAIHLDVRGENGAWCGGAAAGLTALRAAVWSIREGRCDTALVVAADTWVSAGGVRDLLRIADGAGIDAPGEAGVALLLESEAHAAARGAPAMARVTTERAGAPARNLSEHHAALGDCHAADALLAVAMCIGEGRAPCWVQAQEGNQPAVGVAVAVEGGVACYPRDLAGGDRG